MVNTNSHALISVFLIQKIFKIDMRVSPYLYSIIWGSFFPDLSMFLFFLYYLAAGEDMNEVFGTHYYKRGWTLTFDYHHSAPIAAFLCLIAFLIYWFKYRRDSIIAIRNSATLNRNLELAVSNNASGGVEPASPKSEKARVSYLQHQTSDLEFGVSYNIDETKSDINNTRRDVAAVEGSPTRVVSLSMRHKEFDNDCRNCWPCVKANPTPHVFAISMTLFFAVWLFHNITDFLTHSDDAHATFLPITDWVWRSPVSYWDNHHYAYILGPIESVTCIAICVWLWFLMRHHWKGEKCCCGCQKKDKCGMRIDWIWAAILIGNIVYYLLNIVAVVFFIS